MGHTLSHWAGGTTGNFPVGHKPLVCCVLDVMTITYLRFGGFFRRPDILKGLQRIC